MYNEIKGDIISRRLQGGERLVVGDLARKYDVSPMPVREALIRLEKEGFLQIIPHVGAKVSRFNERQLGEVHQIRIELEAIASRLLAPVITDQQLKTLDSLLERGQAIVATGDVDEYFLWNTSFHLTVAGMNPNSTLREYIESIWQKLNLFSDSIGIREWRAAVSLAEHRLWVEALRSHNPAEAESACRRHCEATTEFTFDVVHHQV